MPLTKCPTVRSGGTIKLRSALMPTLKISRASMGFSPSFRGALCADPSGPSRNDNAAAIGRRVSLLRCGGALDEGLAALHLVGERRLVDLDHDVVGIDAEVLYQRLRDISHHAGLLFFGAACGHADGNLGHCRHSPCSCYITLAANTILIAA